MTRKEFKKIAQRLLHELPGLMVKEDLIFIQPIDHLLRGICFQGSIDKRAFYVWKFVQPLFIPAEDVWLNFGDRLNLGKSWDADDPYLFQSLIQSIKEEGLPYIMSIKNVEAMIDLLASREKNGNALQAIAFSLARIGKIDKACEKLEELAERMNRPNEYNMRIPWREETAQRALSLKSLLLKDPQTAQKQLDEWEAYTVKNLKLEKYI